MGILNTPLLRAQSQPPGNIPNPRPMATDGAPVFEVATIKLSNFAEGVRLQLDSSSGLFRTRGTSLEALIVFAYDLHRRQIVGGPAWLDRDRYDVTANPDKPGKPSLAQLRVMLRKLLADRFELSFHHDQKELSVYAITSAKSGPKLSKNNSDTTGLFGGMGIGLGRLGFTNITMAEFATMLQGSSIMDRPVVDQTGLGAVRYDFTLKWTPVGPQAQRSEPERGGDSGDAPPDLFTAFQEQLGLKLEPAKALVDVLVIDRVARPSEN
jgi:uncharacterized protein (TIGR03435 family)